MSMRIGRRCAVAVIAVAIAAFSVVAGGPPTLAQREGFGSVNQAGNGLLAYSSSATGNKDIYTSQVDGSSQADISLDPSTDTTPAWSPNGTQIAFASNRTGDFDVYVMDENGAGQVDLTNTIGTDSSPTWSPDGTQIAFSGTRGGNSDIYVMNADGSGQTDITNASGTDSVPSWSPDGTQIAFASNRGGNFDVYVMNADGSGQTDITNATGADSNPAWSPDGNSITFNSNRSGNSDVYVMNADGTGQTDLSNNPAQDTDPTYSPDGGTRIAFITNRDGTGEVYTMRTTDGANQVNITHSASSETAPSWQPLSPAPFAPTPIQHVVVLYQENHAFDNVLGLWCAQHPPCEGATQGQTHDGQTIQLRRALDIAPVVAHNHKNQTTAVNDGLMNGFDLVDGCEASTNYQCYVQYQQDQIPNLWNLASNFTVSDHTFEMDFVPTWHAHVELAAADLDGFDPRKFPFIGTDGTGPGWGCDSFRDDHFAPTIFDDYTNVPACIPEIDGAGPYKTSPAPWVPTIMDRIQQNGLSWHLYAPSAEDGTLSYGFAICPTFADCLYTSEQQNVLSPDQFAVDAAAGALPNLSLLIARAADSQHNQYSMLQGDNWIANNVNAVMSGPDWNSTAIFIVYDDCGCFYDHMPPPPGLGIRVPMVIVSPYAKVGFIDQNVASFASMLAFTEHTFGLAPLGLRDSTAYDFSDSFDYGQRPLAPIRLQTHPVPAWELHWIAEHPGDPNDPT